MCALGEVEGIQEQQLVLQLKEQVFDVLVTAPLVTAHRLVESRLERLLPQKGARELEPMVLGQPQEGVVGGLRPRSVVEGIVKSF